jgi:hypothetical protein
VPYERLLHEALRVDAAARPGEAGEAGEAVSESLRPQTLSLVARLAAYTEAFLALVLAAVFKLLAVYARQADGRLGRDLVRVVATCMLESMQGLALADLARAVGATLGKLARRALAAVFPMYKWLVRGSDSALDAARCLVKLLVPYALLWAMPVDGVVWAAAQAAMPGIKLDSPLRAIAAELVNVVAGVDSMSEKNRRRCDRLDVARRLMDALGGLLTLAWAELPGRLVELLLLQPVGSQTVGMLRELVKLRQGAIGPEQMVRIHDGVREAARALGIELPRIGRWSRFMRSCLSLALFAAVVVHFEASEVAEVARAAEHRRDQQAERDRTEQAKLELLAKARGFNRAAREAMRDGAARPAARLEPSEGLHRVGDAVADADGVAARVVALDVDDDERPYELEYPDGSRYWAGTQGLVRAPAFGLGGLGGLGAYEGAFVTKFLDAYAALLIAHFAPSALQLLHCNLAGAVSAAPAYKPLARPRAAPRAADAVQLDRRHGLVVGPYPGAQGAVSVMHDGRVAVVAATQPPGFWATLEERLRALNVATPVDFVVVTADEAAVDGAVHRVLAPTGTALVAARAHRSADAPDRTLWYAGVVRVGDAVYAASTKAESHAWQKTLRCKMPLASDEAERCSLGAQIAHSVEDAVARLLLG